MNIIIGSLKQPKDSLSTSWMCRCGTELVLSGRGLKVSGSKKELARALQEAMQAQDEKDGGESRTLCRRLEEGCQCLMDGAVRLKPESKFKYSDCYNRM